MHSIRHLELIETLAEHRHFGRAAAALGISQPALTRSLKMIEERLGVTLFDRDGVAPTLFGRIVLERGALVRAEFAEMVREISLAKGLDLGELTVVSGPYAAEISGQRAIAEISARHPNLAVRLSVVNWTQAVEDVLAGAADLGLAEISEADENPDLETERLSSLPMFFFCAAHHPLAREPDISLGQLIGFPWVGPTAPGRFSAALPHKDGPFGTFDRATNRFLPRITVETFSAARNIVLLGQALAVAPPFLIERELERGDCVMLPIELPWLRLNYGFIIRRGRRRSPAAEAFMKAVRAIEREVGG